VSGLAWDVGNYEAEACARQALLADANSGRRRNLRSGRGLGGWFRDDGAALWTFATGIMGAEIKSTSDAFTVCLPPTRPSSPQPTAEPEQRKPWTKKKQEQPMWDHHINLSVGPWNVGFLASYRANLQSNPIFKMRNVTGWSTEAIVERPIIWIAKHDKTSGPRQRPAALSETNPKAQSTSAASYCNDSRACRANAPSQGRTSTNAPGYWPKDHDQHGQKARDRGRIRNEVAPKRRAKHRPAPSAAKKTMDQPGKK
jgi:hypothetical protein